MADVLDFATVFGELRIEGSALTFHAHPKIEPRPSAVVVAHVPLANITGVITRFFAQNAGKRHELVTLLAAIDVIQDAVVVCFQPSQQIRARRRTERRGAKRVAKADAFVGDAVDVRGAGKRMPGAG